MALRPIALAAAAFGAAACGGRSGSDTFSALEVTARPILPAEVRVEPGRRSVPLLALEVRALAAAEVAVVKVRIVQPPAEPTPVARVRVVLDGDGDGRFDREADEVLAVLAPLPGGRAHRGPVGRALARGAREAWLVVADALPVSTGATFRASLDPRDLGARGPEPLDGPPVVVEARALSSGALLQAGGARAALRLPPGIQPARVLVAGNPGTDLRRESPGLWSFLLPRTVPGDVEVVALGPAGEVLARVPRAARVNGGSGPARFADRSLTLLPRDHAFSQDAEVADVNGDGAPDLVIPCYSGEPDRLYLNDGDGGFVDASMTHLPADDADTVHIEPADVDGDGDVDLVLAVEGGQNRLWLNDGAGRFRDVTDEPGRMPRDRDYTEDLQAGDLDGDGDLDLVAANLVDPDDQRQGGRLRVYLNDGSGRFADGTAAWVPPVPTRAYDVNLGDLDGDGRLDLLVAGYGERNLLYRNTGSRFEDLSDRLPPDAGFHTSAALGDVDGDGDLDVVVGTFLGPSLLHLNLGELRFADASDRLPAGAMSTYDVALGDADGDGDLDLVFANTANRSMLALNDGAGRFAPAPETDFFTPDDNAYDAQFLDADGDGALDLLITAWGDGQDTLYLSRPAPPPPGTLRLARVEPNHGPPSGGIWLTLRGDGFREGTTAFIGASALEELAVRDARTLEGRLAAGPAGATPVTVRDPSGASVTAAGAFGYEPPPAGAFEDVTALTLGAEPAPSTAVVAGDLDGDRLADLVFADLAVGARVRINTGGGRMRPGAFPPLAASTNDLALGDLDGDARPDLVLADAGGPPRFFAGNGDGTFTAVPGPAEPAAGAEEVALGDLDGDGDLDLVFAVTGPEVVLRNQGGWRFERIDLIGAPSDASRGVALGDLDGDRDLDLVVVNFMDRTRLWLNDGTGRFQAEPDLFPRHDGDQSYAVALADVDGDGDLDAAIANGGAQVNRLFLNDGRARFVDAPSAVFRAALGGGADLAFGDVDGDGDPDLLGAHFWGNNHLYFTEGGRLSERGGMLPTSPGGFAGAAFADVDGDGDLDVVFAAFWGGSRILRNPR